MTFDPAMQAVHDRLEGLAAAMPVLDVDAGWAALAARLEDPLADVVPLRRPRRARRVLLLAAAALLLAGGAYAAVRQGHAAERLAVTPAPMGVTGPHTRPAIGGPPADFAPTRDEPGGSPPARNGGRAPGTSGDPAPSGGPAGDGRHGGGHGSDSHHREPPEDPNDRDQGTGNDGHHDDNGGGNDGPEGTPHHRHGEGHGTQGHGGGSGHRSGGSEHDHPDHGRGGHGGEHDNGKD